MCSIAKAHTRSYTHTQKKFFSVENNDKIVNKPSVKESQTDRKKNSNERKGNIESKRIRRNKKKKRSYTQAIEQVALTLWVLGERESYVRLYVCVCACVYSLRFNIILLRIHKKRTQFNRWLLLVEILISRFN